AVYSGHDRFVGIQELEVSGYRNSSRMGCGAGDAHQVLRESKIHLNGSRSHVYCLVYSILSFSWSIHDNRIQWIRNRLNVQMGPAKEKPRLIGSRLNYRIVYFYPLTRVAQAGHPV